MKLAEVTDYVCPGGYCRAVIGDAVTYLDVDHLTATYARTLAPMIAAAARPPVALVCKTPCRIAVPSGATANVRSHEEQKK